MRASQSPASKEDFVKTSEFPLLPPKTKSFKDLATLLHSQLKFLLDENCFGRECQCAAERKGILKNAGSANVSNLKLRSGKDTTQEKETEKTRNLVMQKQKRIEELEGEVKYVKMQN